MIDDVLRDVRRASDCFSRAKIKDVEVAGDIVTVHMISNKAYAVSDLDEAQNALRKYVPDEFALVVRIEKITPDERMVEERIREKMKDDFPTAYYAMDPGDVVVKRRGDGFYFKIFVPSIFASFDALKAAVIKTLARAFCEDIDGECVEKKEVSRPEVIKKSAKIAYRPEARTFPVKNFKRLTGDAKRDKAVYISDIDYADGDFCICGTLRDIVEKSYIPRSGGEPKKFFILTVQDPTGTCETRIFPTARMTEDIVSLKEGDGVVCSGRNEEYRDRWSFKTERVDFGQVPEAFEPKARKSRPAPSDYTCVRPEPFSDLSQGNIFVERKSVGPKGTYVVYDIETTGLNYHASSGTMDDIIDLGAFKIVDGVICERFTTFVKPQKEITAEITNLTGITQDTVRDAPSIDDVIADFYLFTRGATLVGHNILDFDSKFIDFYGQKEGYIFDNPMEDTILMARRSLPYLKNYRLSSVAEVFDIRFTPHRAVDDALATAKVFLNLEKT